MTVLIAAIIIAFIAGAMVGRRYKRNKYAAKRISPSISDAAEKSTNQSQEERIGDLLEIIKTLERQLEFSKSREETLIKRLSSLRKEREEETESVQTGTAPTNASNSSRLTPEQLAQVAIRKWCPNKKELQPELLEALTNALDALTRLPADDTLSKYKDSLLWIGTELVDFDDFEKNEAYAYGNAVQSFLDDLCRGYLDQEWNENARERGDIGPTLDRRVAIHYDEALTCNSSWRNFTNELAVLNTIGLLEEDNYEFLVYRFREEEAFANDDPADLRTSIRNYLEGKKVPLEILDANLLWQAYSEAGYEVSDFYEAALLAGVSEEELQAFQSIVDEEAQEGSSNESSGTGIMNDSETDQYAEINRLADQMAGGGLDEQELSETMTRFFKLTLGIAFPGLIVSVVDAEGNAPCEKNRYLMAESGELFSGVFRDSDNICYTFEIRESESGNWTAVYRKNIATSNDNEMNSSSYCKGNGDQYTNISKGSFQDPEVNGKAKTSECQDASLDIIQKDRGSDEKENVVLSYAGPGACSATARINHDGRFCVLEGSECNLTETRSCPSQIRELRSKLVENGILVERSGKLVFDSRYAFNSPSQASSVVYGGSSNGRSSWVDSKGRTLNQLIDEYGWSI